MSFSGEFDSKSMGPTGLERVSSIYQGKPIYSSKRPPMVRSDAGHSVEGIVRQVSLAQSLVTEGVGDL